MLPRFRAVFPRTVFPQTVFPQTVFPRTVPRAVAAFGLLLFVILWATFQAAGPAEAQCRLLGEARPDGDSQAEAPARIAPEGSEPDGAGVWIWQARPGDELACDTPGFEPVDYGCGGGCTGGEVRLELLPARDVQVRLLPQFETVTIEWRRFGRPGEPTERLATRTYSETEARVPEAGGAKEVLTVPVAATADRILRLHFGSVDGDASRDGQDEIAPHTFYLPPAEASDGEPTALESGRRVKGGSVFGFLENPPDSEEPARYLLQHVSIPPLRLPLTPGEFGQFGLVGLMPGVYRLEAVFDGGATSMGPELEVRPAVTTEQIPWRIAQPASSSDAERAVRGERRVVVVRLPDGSPATDVLAALDRRRLEPSRPGEFELTGVTTASQVRILPPDDYVGVCRTVGGAAAESERLEIDLQPATAEAILIPARDRLPPLGRYLGVLEGLPGSDCPVPVALQWEPFRDEHDRERIRVKGLVPGVYTLRLTNGDLREVSVPGPPVPLGPGDGP